MLSLVYPALVWLGVSLGGFWLWAPLLLNIVLVPLLDHLFARSRPSWRMPSSWQRRYFSLPVFWLYAIAQAAALWLALQRVSEGPGFVESFALASSVGIMTGTAGITAAHELIHRRDPLQRALGLGLLSMVGYMHFRIEHAYGHHRHVATADDPASAALGESFPSFLLRSLRGGLRSAWEIEIRSLQRRGKRPWSWGNRMLHYALIQAAICVALLEWGGAALLGWFLLQSFIAVHLLEAVNYVQHYGLRRDTGAAGVEALGPQHAWDADDAVSRLLVFNLSRHAEHHLRVTRPCDRLEAMPEAPRLPFSFFLMVFLALFPPLWHRLMDDRVPGQGRSLRPDATTTAGAAAA